MGFMDAMKGANNNWGHATGSFGLGYFGPKNLVNNKAQELMISGTGIETVVFKDTDVETLKMIAATSKWVKYKLRLKNGFEAILTLRAWEETRNGADVAMSYRNFEWAMASVLYKD